MDLRRRIRRPKRLVDDAAFMARGRCQSRPAVPAVCVPVFPIPFTPYNPEKVRSQPAAFPSLDITETVAQRQERVRRDLERKEREEAENEDGWGSSDPDDSASDRELVQRAIARAKRRRRREGGDLATVAAAEMAKIKHCKRSRQEALNRDHVALDLQDEEEEEPRQKAPKLLRPSSPNAQMRHRHLPENFLRAWSQEETERIGSPVTQPIGVLIAEPAAINTPPEWPSKKRKHELPVQRVFLKHWADLSVPERKARVGGSSPPRQPALNLHLKPPGAWLDAITNRQMGTMLQGPRYPTFDSSEQEMPAPELPARPRGRQPKVGADIPSRQPTLPLRSQQPLKTQEKPYIVHRTAELAIAASRAGSALTRGTRPPNTPPLPLLTFKSISCPSDPGTTTDMKTATSSTTVPAVKPTASAKSTSPPPPKRRRTGKGKQTSLLPTPPITTT
ncbi:hypothetical protein LTR16_002864, partial [Cryomyces antarcticus]